MAVNVRISVQELGIVTVEGFLRQVVDSEYVHSNRQARLIKI